MMDINNVGGPNKRKGWRMNYSFDGHYVWDKDNTINAPKTFKAMEAIGYEGIAHLINSDGMWSKLLEDTEKPHQNKSKKEKIFFVIFINDIFLKIQINFKNQILIII